MSQQKVVEVNSNPLINKEMKKLKQYLASVVASLGGFSLGVCLGWNSSSSELLKNYVNGYPAELGLVGGIFSLGVCLGLILVPVILRGLSRPGAMMLTVPVLFLGWSCVVFAGHRVPLLILGRILCGISGTFCLLVPIYVSEIAHKNIRGTLSSIFQLMINLGMMFAFLLAHFTNGEETIWSYSLACALTTAPVALVILLPESPLYHLTKKDEKRAKISLRYFRGEDFDGLEAEMEELRNLVAIRESNQVTRQTFKDKRFLKSLATSFVVMIVHQLTGISPFIFYALAIFNAHGSADISPIAETLVVGLSQIVGSIVAALLIDVIGRRALLIASSSLMVAALVLLGWFFNIQETDPEYGEELSWMPLTWISLLFGGFNLGVGPIAWVYLGEIFPIHARLVAGTTTSVFNWLVSLCLTLSFGEILDVFGESNAMWFFAGISMAGGIFAALFVDETKLKSLMEIQVNFHITDSTQL